MNGRIAHSAVKRCVIACSVCSARAGVARPRRATNSASGHSGQPARPASLLRCAAVCAEVVARRGRREAGLDHVGGGAEVGRQRGLQCGGDVQRARLQFERVEPVQRQALEARVIEARPGPTQVARRFAHALRVDQELERLSQGAPAAT